jgi:hypothetical protein
MVSPQKPCKLELHYDSEGILVGGLCDCGQKFYPFSSDPKDAQKALQYMEKEWREHQTERYPEGDES